MPPKTRSGRAEKLEAQQLIQAGRANISGLPASPPETLLHIASYFGSIPIPYQERRQEGTPPEFLERSKALEALCQTCQRLRYIFLPILWRKIEVGAEKHGALDTMHPRRLAMELVRQLEIVTVRNPALANHVRQVSVFVDYYSSETAFPEFARALHLFPNMHTLQIIGPNRCIRTRLAQGFQGHSYPNVRLLVIRHDYHALLECVPNVRYLYTSDGVWLFEPDVWSSMLAFLGKSSSLMTMHGFVVADRESLVKLIMGLRHLRDVQISGDYLFSDRFGNLELFPELLQQAQSLKILRILLGNPRHQPVDNYPRAKDFAKEVLAALKKLQPGRELQILIVNPYGNNSAAVTNGGIREFGADGSDK